MRPMLTQRITPATIPVLAKTDGILNDPKAIASTIRQIVSFFHPLSPVSQARICSFNSQSLIFGFSSRNRFSLIKTIFSVFLLLLRISVLLLIRFRQGASWWMHCCGLEWLFDQQWNEGWIDTILKIKCVLMRWKSVDHKGHENIDVEVFQALTIWNRGV